MFNTQCSLAVVHRQQAAGGTRDGGTREGGAPDVGRGIGAQSVAHPAVGRFLAIPENRTAGLAGDVIEPPVLVHVGQRSLRPRMAGQLAIQEVVLEGEPTRGSQERESGHDQCPGDGKEGCPFHSAHGQPTLRQEGLPSSQGKT